jgi:hypothetical protein
MRQRMLRNLSPGRVLSTMLEAKQFAERLPGRVNKVLDALATNELKLKVEMIDEGAIIEGLQKVANRVALGLVMAALIVAAALIMQVPTTFRLLGYPGLAMILFVIAAGARGPTGPLGRRGIMGKAGHKGPKGLTGTAAQG